MLSFEEFFHKKKIDLTALQAGEPALHAEFLKHYAAMGEKSFDHTKKFWFNKLRKRYLLAAGEPAPIPEKPLATSDSSIKPVSEVVPAEPSATTAKPAGFKPRFKAGAKKVVAPESEKPKETISSENKAESTSAAEEKPATEESATPISKPAGFKPRFKAGAKKVVARESEKPKETISAENKTESTSAAEEKPATEESATPVSKPAGFKPRFKAGATKTVSTEQTKPEETISVENKKTSAPEEKPATEESTTPVSKPAGFKPRFKAGVTKPSKPKDDQ